MEIKKSQKADLESKRWIGFLLGLLIALSCFFVAMEYNSNGSADDDGSSSLVHSVKLHNLEMLPAIDQQDISQVKDEKKPTIDDMLNVKRSDTPNKVTPRNVGSMNSSDKVTAAPRVSDDIMITVNPTLLPDVPKVEQVSNKVKEKMTDDDADKEVERTDEKVSSRILSETPTPPGGWVEFMKWLTKSLKYPDAAQESKSEGVVSVTFIIAKDGTVSDVKVKDGKYKYFTNEVMRVLATMGKWKPGISKGKPCMSMIEIPIVFKL